MRYYIMRSDYYVMRKMCYIMRKSYYVMHKLLRYAKNVLRYAVIITLCGNYYVMRRHNRHRADEFVACVYEPALVNQ